MAKRKAKRTAKRKPKRNRKEPSQPEQRLQRTGLYSLPDHLMEEILHWIRPNDEDQSIWQWVCRMSATCAAFRRIICSVRPGGVPLTPTKLVMHSLVWEQQDLLTLMNTIRRSGWMGANIQSVEWDHHVFQSDQAAIDGLACLLTTPGKLTNLTKVHFTCYQVAGSGHIRIGSKLFLRDLSRLHPSIMDLALSNGVLGEQREDHLSPRVFARLASSLPNLERFKITDVGWLESNHLIAFLSSVGSKITHLALIGIDEEEGTRTSSAFNDEVFASIAANCHNLETLRVTDCSIPSREFNSILRSNRNILHVDVTLSRCDNGRRFFDSIAEYTPGLEEFDGAYCDWIDADSIRTLINDQINAFGRILLRKLDVLESGVTPQGLRSFLSRWREASHTLPLKVRCWWSDDEYRDGEAIIALRNDFPEVGFGSDYRR